MGAVLFDAPEQEQLVRVRSRQWVVNWVKSNCLSGDSLHGMSSSQSLPPVSLILRYWAGEMSSSSLGVVIR
jgi:hypothetical protein